MNTTKNYPTNKVITLYPLLGGFIGGVLVGVLAEVSNLDTIKEIPEFIGTLLFFGVLGIFFGLIPASIAGFITAKCRLYKNIWWHYPIITLIGFVPSALIGLGLILLEGIYKWNKLSDIGFFMVVLGAIGAISALIMAMIALPKKKIKDSNE